MKIKQVDIETIKNEINIKGLAGDNMYRLLRVDDSNYGKTNRHHSLKLKSIRNLSIEEFIASADDDNCAFIVVEDEQ